MPSSIFPATNSPIELVLVFLLALFFSLMLHGYKEYGASEKAGPFTLLVMPLIASAYWLYNGGIGAWQLSDLELLTTWVASATAVAIKWPKPAK